MRTAGTFTSRAGGCTDQHLSRTLRDWSDPCMQRKWEDMGCQMEIGCPSAVGLVVMSVGLRPTALTVHQWFRVQVPFLSGVRQPQNRTIRFTQRLTEEKPLNKLLRFRVRIPQVQIFAQRPVDSLRPRQQNLSLLRYQINCCSSTGLIRLSTPQNHPLFAS
jgi:hypothetical protein